MSGTSLDGLDIVYCEYSRRGNKWNFSLKASETRKYTTFWTEKLSRAYLLSGKDLLLLDREFGYFIGSACKSFIKRYKVKSVDFIASHGHTIFHLPEKKFTFQLGSGVAINSVTGLPVVNDFRSLDVLKGGQGAPLVPIGDHYLFSEFDTCLNLGGIANLSRMEKGKITAFDICYVNMGLNFLSNKMQLSFDKDGHNASNGITNEKILTKLNNAYDRWRKAKPSLGREGFENIFKPILDDERVSLQDRLRSFCESICSEISLVIPKKHKKIKLLATGGGALNRFLIELLKNKIESRADIIIPDKSIINFKEAVIFGFLGVLRVRDETNVLKSVTGATSNSSAGNMIGFNIPL